MRVKSLLILFLLVGCGFDKKSLSDIRLLSDDERVEYSNGESGAYDLSEYLFPNENQTNVYEVSIKRQMGGEYPIGEGHISKIDVKYNIEGNSIEEGGDITYFINDFNLTKREIVDGFYVEQKYRRFVDVNQTYYSYEHVDGESILYQIGWVTCRVVEHNDFKEILGNKYSDVLVLTCKSKSKEGARGKFDESRSYESKSYFAKGIGKIGAIGEECEIKKYDRVYRSCKQVTKQLKDIIKEN